jgi:hypothetical protein
MISLNTFKPTREEMTWERDRPTKNVVIIPTPPFEGCPEEYGPLQLIKGKTVLRRAYLNAKELGDTIVAAPSREICQYCHQLKVRWRPVKSVGDRTGVQICQEVYLQMRTNAKVDVIIYWPWYRIDLELSRTEMFIQDASQRNIGHYAVDETGLDILGVFPSYSLHPEGQCDLVRSTYKEVLPPATTEEHREQLKLLL